MKAKAQPRGKRGKGNILRRARVLTRAGVLVTVPRPLYRLVSLQMLSVRRSAEALVCDAKVGDGQMRLTLTNRRFSVKPCLSTDW
jgi:hypothetical protein